MGVEYLQIGVNRLERGFVLPDRLRKMRVLSRQIVPRLFHAKRALPEIGRVFAEPELLERLNQIVHPAVKEDILEKQPDFVESAILYEAGLDAICDKIFVIEAPEDIRIARTIARDYHGDASPENIDKVRARIRAQQSSSPLHGGTERGFILINDGRKSIEELAGDIIALIG